MATRPPLHRAAIPLLLAIGLAIHACWLFGPFGFYEVNAGYFFGPFAQNWERFGWLALGGTPLGANVVALPEVSTGGFAYFNHPPGFAWLCSLFGTAEWQLRLPCVLATAFNGPLLFALARERLAEPAAFAAALLVQVVPVIAFGAVISYEAPVITIGLLLLLACERAREGHRGWRIAAVAAAACGVWLDWAFLFYAAALVAWSLPASPRRLVQKLWLPAAGCVTSLALIVIWRLWASALPTLPHDQVAQESLSSTLHRAVFAGPPWNAFFAAMTDRFRDGFSWPLLAAGALGTIPAAMRSPRLLAALWIPAVLNIGIFRSHAMGHLMFAAYAGPPIALAAGHLLAGLARWPVLRRPAALVAAALFAITLWHTADWKRGATSPLLRDIAFALNDLAAEPAPANDPRTPLIVTNTLYIYPYYVHTPRVLLTPEPNAAQLEKQRGGQARLRYVYFDHEIQTPAGPLRAPDQPLRDWLAKFPHRELPQFIGEWPMGNDSKVVVRGASVYDL